MMTALAVLAVLTVAATGVILLLRHPRPDRDELLRIHETWMTAVLGLALWAEAAVLLYCGFTVPERLLTSRNAVINTGIFLTVSLLLGAWMILYTVVKYTAVTEEGLVLTDVVGRRKTLAWGEVVRVEQSAGKRLTLYDAAGRKYTVGGSREAFRRFVAVASGRIDPAAGGRVFQQLKTALKM